MSSFYFSREPPMYRDFHTATAIGDKMFIFGGRSDKSANEPFGIHGYHPHHFPGLQAEFYSDKLVYLVSFSNSIFCFARFTTNIRKYRREQIRVLWAFCPIMNEG